MTDKHIMTVGQVRDKLKDCADDFMFDFGCSCSRKGGYDGWIPEIQIEGKYVRFYLSGFHDSEDEDDK